MRRFIIIGFIAILFILLGCSNEKLIEKSISDFEDAVNNNSTGDIKEILSPESDFYITETFSEFLGYFDGLRPVSYSNLDINVQSSDADVNADATYAGTPVSGGVLFMMKKDETFFSFLFPDWKVYRYYDYGDLTDPVWRKINIISE